MPKFAKGKGKIILYREGILESPNYSIKANIHWFLFSSGLFKPKLFILLWKMSLKKYIYHYILPLQNTFIGVILKLALLIQK